eukprot:260829_1
MLPTEEKKQCDTDELQPEPNPYVDTTLMKNLEDFNVESNTKFISKHEVDKDTNITFPKTIQTPPESKEFVISDEDFKICTHLYNTYKSQITEFTDFGDDIIYRYMSGYRHIDDYDTRLAQTDELFSEYLLWRKSSDFENILNTKEIHNVPINEYINGCYIYGQDIYGHPIFFDEGLKYHKDSDLTIYKDCGEEGTDKVLGYLLQLLQKMKQATNKYYELETKLYFGSENNTENSNKNENENENDDKNDTENAIEDENENENESKQIETGKVGIIRHVVVFDLSHFSSWRVITDMKVHEYYMRRFSTLFPEMIHKAYVINTPWVFKQIWKIVKGFLHPNTVEKTVILGSDYKKTLFEEIHPDFIPKKYGGNGQWEIVDGSIPKDYPIQLL